MNVGEALFARRAELGLSRAAAAKKAGIDVGTLRSAELNERWPQDVNRAKIEQALGWAPGSLEAIRDGGEPTELAGDRPSESKTFFPGGTADAKQIINETAEAMHRPGTTLGDFDETTRAFFDKVTQLATINGLVGAVENPEHPQALAAIRASLRENIGRHGVTPDLVRTVAAGHLSAVVSQLDARRRDQVVELAYQLLDEKEAEDGDVNSFGKTERSEVSDLAARRDSNSEVRSIRAVVDDDDPTAGIDWRDYAAHPRTEPLEEDNPTP